MENRENEQLISQLEIWKNHTLTMSVDSIVHAYENPNIPQKELSEYLNSLINANNLRNCIEVGCEQGITSFLLEIKERYFLDYNDHIIDLLKKVDAVIDHTGENTYIVGNMFEIPIENEKFDLVFNSGVLEHYSQTEIQNALAEMKRILTDDGYVVIAIPNHFSWVYRLAYLLGQVLDFWGIQKWPYPKENKIYDLKKEAGAVGLELVERLTLSEKSLHVWWGGRKKFIWNIIKVLIKVKPAEGYLTVLKYKKSST